MFSRLEIMNMNKKSLEDLDSKIKTAQKGQKTLGKKPKKAITSGADLGMGMKIASDLIAGVLVGIFLGYTLDNFLETKPLFIVVFVFVGFIAGMVNVYRTAEKIEQSRKKSSHNNVGNTERK